MVIEGLGVYKGTIISVRWLPLSVIKILSGYRSENQSRSGGSRQQYRVSTFFKLSF